MPYKYCRPDRVAPVIPEANTMKNKKPSCWRHSCPLTDSGQGPVNAKTFDSRFSKYILYCKYEKAVTGQDCCRQTTTGIFDERRVLLNASSCISLPVNVVRLETHVYIYIDKTAHEWSTLKLMLHILSDGKHNDNIIIACANQICSLSVFYYY